jgi:hypothetical protein
VLGDSISPVESVSVEFVEINGALALESTKEQIINNVMFSLLLYDTTSASSFRHVKDVKICLFSFLQY